MAQQDSRKLEPTKTPGVYKRGSSYVVRWKHRGQPKKRHFRTYALAREFKGKLDGGGDRRAPTKETVESYYETWIENYRGRTARGLEETTREEYRRSFRLHVLGLLGRVKLRDLGSRDVSDWFGAMERRGVTPNSIRKARAALGAMLADAAQAGDIPANPATGVRYVPSAATQARHAKRERRKLTAADVGAILAVMPEQWRVFFELLTQTGIRVGEALGLTWGRVELGDDPHILVTEQVYKGKRKRLKTEASLGRVPLAPSMAARLAAVKPEGAGAEAPVFASDVGTPLNYGNVYNRVLRPALRDCGIATKGEDGKWDYQGVAFHAFRKACGSLLFAAGRNGRQVQGWLRHSQLTTTMNVYVHEVDDGLGGADVWEEIGAAWGHQGATGGPQVTPNGDSPSSRKPRISRTNADSRRSRKPP